MEAHNDPNCKWAWNIALFWGGEQVNAFSATLRGLVNEYGTKSNSINEKNTETGEGLGKDGLSV
jgi:hypothetical protein